MRSSVTSRPSLLEYEFTDKGIIDTFTCAIKAYVAILVYKKTASSNEIQWVRAHVRDETLFQAMQDDVKH